MDGIWQLQIVNYTLNRMFISIDIGGTSTRVASSINLSDVESIETFASSRDIEVQKKLIQSAINKISGQKSVAGFAVGIAGVINVEKCAVEKSPNYSNLNGIFVRDLLGSVPSDVKVVCCNDSKMAAIGESVLGAGKSYNKVAYVSLGTGVGAALVINKKIDDNAFEIGHHVVDVSSDIQDGFSISGSFETLASGTAFKRMYGISSSDCTDKKIWHEYGKNVAVGLLNITLFWNPDCIVIGGGVADNFEDFIEGTRAYFSKINFTKTPKIIKSTFGQGSGVVGGFVLLNQLNKLN